MDHVLAAYPELPFWPQLPQRHASEDMRAQAGRADLDPREVFGWRAGLVALRSGRTRRLKCQVTGPATAGEDPRRTAQRARWCVRQVLAEGGTALLFIDEPLLAPGGVAGLEVVVDAAREEGAAGVGVHCCGRAPWGEYLACSADWVSVDLGRYGEAFLDQAALALRLAAGRGVAWGIVPTDGLEAGVDPRGSADALVEALEARGLSIETALGNALVMPACGTGTLRVGDEELVAVASAGAAARLRDHLGSALQARPSR